VHVGVVGAAVDTAQRVVASHLAADVAVDNALQFVALSGLADLSRLSRPGRCREHDACS
jgi:hypothetical protein